VSCRARRQVGDFGNDAWHKALLRVGEMSGVGGGGSVLATSDAADQYSSLFQSP
jgi:hypothetical protein